MNKFLRVSFPVVTIIRVLCVAGTFIIPKLRPDTPGGFLSGLEIHFEWWEYLLMYAIMLTFFYNSIVSLLLSFKPAWVFTGLLTPKTVLLVFYIAELLIALFFIYFVTQEISDTFFPGESYYQSDIFAAFFPAPEIDIYDKLEVINMAVLAFCSLLFIVFFWSFYIRRKKMLNPDIYL